MLPLLLLFQVAADPDIQKLASEVSPARIKETIATLAAFGTRHPLSRTDSKTEGTGAARDWIEAQMKACAAASGGRMTVERREYEVESRRLRGRVKLVNLVATLRGESDPGRVYLVSGHYDSRNSADRNGTDPAPGANDDGSGTALALELCRVMTPRRFAATIQFVAFDGEEQGCLGSGAMAKEMAEKKVELDGMMTADIVGNTLALDGRRETGYVRCFSYAQRGNDTPGRELARCLAEAARTYVDKFTVKLIFRGDRFGRGGDHGPFMREGFASVRLTEPLEDWTRQHQNVKERDGKPYADLPEFVDADYVANVTRVAGSTIATLARAPRPVARVAARQSMRAYDTELTITPVATPGLEQPRYEVVWRDTAAADWEHSRPIPEQQGAGRFRFVLAGVLLDDCVVAVRAVGPDGHRSRPVAPPEPDAFEQRGGGGAGEGAPDGARDAAGDGGGEDAASRPASRRRRG